MQRSFWTAAAISLAAYAGALLLGFWADFRLALFIVLALQVTWTLFCAIRLTQFRWNGAYKRDAEPYEREAYAFALGGFLSSMSLLAVIVVLTQVV